MNEEPKSKTPPTPPKPAQPSPAAEAEQAALDASAAAEAMGKPKMSRKKRLMVTALVVVALLVAGCAVWYFVFRKSPPPAPAPASVQPAEEKVLKPSQIIYTQPGSDESIQTLRTVPLLGGSSNSVTGLNSVEHIDVEKKVVAVSTHKIADGQATDNVMVSTDSGKSFTSVFESIKPGGDSAAITSIKLSGDGSKVAFGYTASSESGTNTVKSVDIASKKIEDLFVVQQLGTFLEGYDSAKQTVYYFAGCYFCDGNTMNKLLSQKAGQTEASVLYERPETLGVDLEFNTDFTKAAVSSGVQSEEGIGPGQPFKAEQFTLADKSFKTLGTSTAAMMYAGFSVDGSSIYYTDGNKVFSVDSGGSKVLAFEAEQPISGVGYVGSDYVVVQSGQEAKDSLVTFDIKQNKATTVVQPTANLLLGGVAWE